MKKVRRSIEDYRQILYLPHYVSPNKVPMPMTKRAAQFSPFSAVVGHDTAVKEATRYTCKKKILDEMEKSLIDECLRKIESNINKKSLAEVEIVYFKADDLKDGGHYRTKIAAVKKIDVYTQTIHFTDIGQIDIDDIYSIMLL